MSRLANQVVIITGSASGLGAAIAERCAAEGAQVVVADIDGDAAGKQTARLNEQGHSAIGVQFDLGDTRSVNATIERTVKEFGRVDVLVNNAAATGLTATDGSIIDAEEELWDSTFAVNVRGTAMAIKAAAKQFIAQGGGGAVVNLASAAGHAGDLRWSAYGASKAAIMNLTRYAATQLGPHRIRVNAIAPGMIITPATEPLKPLFTPHQAISRGGEARDVASAAVFLASDEASFITGQVLNVDGGLLMHVPYMADLKAAQ